MAAHVTKNELVLLDAALASAQEARERPVPDDVAFELFACEQALKGYDLSPEEIEAGRVGGGRDGALDGVYVFLGDRLLAEDDEVLSEDSPPSTFARNQTLTLWLVQAKRAESFTETAIDLAASSLDRLLDLQRSEEELARLYSPEVVQRVRMFTTAWQKLATRRAKLRINFVYATRGDVESIHDAVRTKATELEKKLASLVSGCEAKVSFLGSSELWSRYNQVASYTLELAFQENATSGNSHVAIVKLDEYYSFITDGEDSLLRHIFDWNVRDYQGDVEVNREIRATLEDSKAPEFWWMNNGVSVVCSAAKIVSKTYILDDVQIVNGLQTSHTVYEVLRQKGEVAESAGARLLLVRILVTQDAGVRDKVIRATNRQTSVPVASLRATDEIQRSLESYFAGDGWYYDRRKNYYRNMGKPSDRIIGIAALAQAVMAMGFSEANNSRARPSSLLKRDEDYRRVFSKDVPLKTYLWIARSQRRVDDHLTADVTGSASERTNLRFYVSMLLAAKAIGGRVYSPAQLNSLAANDHTFSDEEVTQTFQEVKAMSAGFSDDPAWTLDRTAKSQEFVAYTLDRTFDPDA